MRRVAFCFTIECMIDVIWLAGDDLNLLLEILKNLKLIYLTVVTKTEEVSSENTKRRLYLALSKAETLLETFEQCPVHPLLLC